MPIRNEFEKRYDGLFLWSPKNSIFFRNVKLLDDKNHENLRPGSVILASENNILAEENIRTLLKIHNELNNINTNHGLTFKDLCYMIPTTYGSDACLETSLLELWASRGNYDELNSNVSKIGQNNDIVELMNNKTMPISGIFGTPLKYKSVVGKLELSKSRVNSAKALRLIYVLEETVSRVHSNTSKYTGIFEREILMMLSNITFLPQGTKVVLHNILEEITVFLRPSIIQRLVGVSNDSNIFIFI